MRDKYVISEKLMRRLMALLEKQPKKDADTVVALWQQLKPKTQPHATA